MDSNWGGAVDDVKCAGGVAAFRGAFRDGISGKMPSPEGGEVLWRLPGEGHPAVGTASAKA